MDAFTGELKCNFTYRHGEHLILEMQHILYSVELSIARNIVYYILSRIHLRFSYLCTVLILRHTL